MARQEGQIWIDKTLHNIKYYVNGHEYIVETSGSYPSAGGSIYCGLPLKLNNEGKVESALFPEDISNIIGVATQNATGASQISVTKNGYLQLKSENLENIFEDYEEHFKEKSEAELKNLIGAPVYWCLKKNSNKLTLNTPSGFYWKRTKGISEEKNVSYDNLPQIGNVAGINFTNNGLNFVEIHVNFSRFDSSFEWSYPAFNKYDDGSAGVEAGIINGSGHLIINHGFNSDIFEKYEIKTLHDVKAKINDEVYTIIGDISESEGKCTLTVNSPYNGRYTVTGRINFRLRKEE